MSENPVVVGSRAHTYHLVDPSPWPLVGSMASLVLAGGVLMWFVRSEEHTSELSHMSESRMPSSA